MIGGRGPGGPRAFMPCHHDAIQCRRARPAAQAATRALSLSHCDPESGPPGGPVGPISAISRLGMAA
eukprot:753816-Hanusia_phi.AAC.1